MRSRTFPRTYLPASTTPAKRGRRPSARWLRAALVAAAACAAAAPAAYAQSGANVLVVVNERDTASEQIGRHYARRRSVPEQNIVRIALEPADEIERRIYERDIEGPIARTLGRDAAHDRILYIVLTKGVPLRITGGAGRQGTGASVDSELALLYRKLTGRAVPLPGRVANPYFLGDRPLAQAARFTHERHDIFLVSRLDGFTVADVIALIDRAAQPMPGGKIVLDERALPGDRAGDAWLEKAAAVLGAPDAGEQDRLVHDRTAAVVSDVSAVLGYFSWGSNDPANQLRTPRLAFLPGAIAASFVSTDARTFKEPPAEWQIGSWNDRGTYFEGSPQSLIGDLVRAGVTGVAGHVAEPYLDAAIRPQVLFPAYLAGFNLVESFYLALPFIGWQNVVVGDPLCAPFRTAPLADPDIHKGIDQATEWPVYFSARRLEAAQAPSSREALTLALRAEARLARDDVAGARRALEEATRLDGRLVSAQLALATIYEGSGDIEAAIERYRMIVDLDPQHVVALNNLAYALAVHRRTPGDGLPLAQKAHTLSKGNPAIADTLGWIHYLLEQYADAARLLADAVRGAPDDPGIHLHAAFAELALGRIDAARAHLQRAIELKPALASGKDAETLQTLLRDVPQ